MGLEVCDLEPSGGEGAMSDRVLDLSRATNQVVARFRYSAELVAAVKLIPGARFVGRDQGGPYWCWTADDVTLAAVRSGMEWLAFAHGFVVTPALRDRFDELEATAGSVPVGRAQIAPDGAGLSPRIPKPSPFVDADATAWLVYNVRGTDVFEAALRAIHALDWNVRRWEAPALRWRVRVSDAGAATIRDLVGLGFRLSESAEMHLAAVGGLESELEQEMAALPDDWPGLADLRSRNGLELRPFQRAGVARALHWKRAINGYQVGLGKTVVALAAARVAGAFPLVVLCQASKKLDWESEAGEWIPGKMVYVLHSRGDPVPGWADVVICNYDILADTSAEGSAAPTEDGVWRKLVALGPRMVVVDESQLIKSQRARRTVAALRVIKSAEYRLLLSGTAVKNHAGELLTQLDAIDVLHRFGGARGFTERYREVEVITVRGREIERERPSAYRAIELYKRLSAWCYDRKTKSEVMPELPPVTRHVVPLRLSNQDEYERASSEFLEWVYETSLEDAEFAAQLPADMPEAERRAAIEEHAAEKTNRASRSEQISRINALKRVAARGILPGVIRWVEERLGDGKLIVFAYHRDIQEALYQAFPGSARLHAADSEEAQQAHKARFQTDPDCGLIVVSMGVGATGHTLTAAYQCAFVELGWTPSEHDQGEGRAYGRVNDPHGLDSYWMVATGTIYEWVIELIDQKRLVVDAILDGIEPEGSDSILSELMTRARAVARATHAATPAQPVLMEV